MLVLLVLVPLIFYAARRSDGSWQGIRMACMGLAWALSTVSLFSTQSALGLEPRLRMAGLPSSALFFGRTFALMACAVAGGGLYAVLISVDQDAVHGWAVAAALMVSAGLSVPLGMLVGRLVPREFEGMLVLITIVGLQTIVDPAQTLAKVLPLWSTRSLLEYGIEGSGNLQDAWLHALGYGTVLLFTGWAITWVRLRRRRHIAILEPTG
ncbi:MAG: hypothetical protein CSA58_12860 [Micrococcales bacterium]|nr:MAG: hypothetical protein CSA58_12860 [Micrococcales bacterium]